MKKTGTGQTITHILLYCCTMRVTIHIDYRMEQDRMKLEPSQPLHNKSCTDRAISPSNPQRANISRVRPSLKKIWLRAMKAANKNPGR